MLCRFAYWETEKKTNNVEDDMVDETLEHTTDTHQ